jgi:hypothetical protein
MALLHKHGFAVVATEHNDFPAVYAAEAWGLSLGLLARTGSLFSRLARMMPPDRLMILARPVATSG